MTNLNNWFYFCGGWRENRDVHWADGLGGEKKILGRVQVRHYRQTYWFGGHVLHVRYETRSSRLKKHLYCSARTGFSCEILLSEIARHRIARSQCIDVCIVTITKMVKNTASQTRYGQISFTFSARSGCIFRVHGSILKNFLCNFLN